MKKFLLFGAAAMLACAANAQTITEMWAHDLSVEGNNIRNCAVLGDQVVVANMGTGLVEFYDATGKTAKSYNVNDFTATQQIGVTGDDGKFTAYNLGRGIEVDEKGNIVVNLNFPNAPSAYNFVAIAADGTMTYIPCAVPSTAGEAARADYFGVSGNVLDQGYIALAMNKVAPIVVYNIYQGLQDPDYSYIIKPEGENVTYSNETDVVFATKTLVLDEEGNAVNAGAFYVYNPSIGNVHYTDGTSALTTITGSVTGGVIGVNKGTCRGAGAFSSNGVDYLVLPAQRATTDERDKGFEVRNAVTGEVVVYCAGAKDFGSAIYQDFSAEVNADGTVNIAQVVQGRYLAMFKLTLDASAIEEIAADNAAVEYYNLQGVKVANPENGIFVKKQGGKATKVVL